MSLVEYNEALLTHFGLTTQRNFGLVSKNGID